MVLKKAIPVLIAVLVGFHFSCSSIRIKSENNPHYLSAQHKTAKNSITDCGLTLKNYEKTIDTTHRPVYATAETMPEILQGDRLLMFFSEKTAQSLKKSTQCFPMRVHYGFVVEANGSISNVCICPIWTLCNDDANNDSIKNQYINYLKTEILKIKTNPGTLQGKKIAVYTIGSVHFSPQK